jgi:hypothetical protein
MSTPSRSRPNRSNGRPTPRDLAPAGVPRRRQEEPVEEQYDDEVYGGPEPADAAVAQEIEARGHYVTASLCGELVRVVPPGAWRQSWMRHLNEGRIDAFAEQVIHPDDIDLYDELDPTNDEFGQFVADASELAGEPMGKSGGPSRSSRRTRRR